MKFGTNLSMKIWGVLFALVAFVAGAKADNKLVIEDFDIIPGETKTISVALDNTDNISSLQFDIDLPEGLYYVKKSTKMNKARLQMHALNGALRSESHVRFGIFHQVAEASKMDKSLILGNSGEIFTFEVKASNYYKGGEIKVYGIQGSDATPEEPVEHDMESFTVKATPSVGTFSLTETSVVKNLNTDNTFSVGLSIANIVDICGLQAYVELPENLVIESMEIGERVSENYIVTPSDMDKSGTILLSSIMAENFEGSDGVVITFNLKAVGAVKGQFVVKDLVATEKTGEASFKIGEAQSVDVEVKPFATIAEDAAVTLPEGELEADEDGFVKATLTGKITVDESIAENAQAVLVYTLNEVNDEAEGGETEGGEAEPTPEEPTTKGGGLFDKDETDEEYAMLDFDVESQEINLAVEAGKKYTLTVKSIVVNYYDENAGEGGDQVVAAEKKFEGDNAIVIDFATAAPAPVLATLDFVALATGDDAAISEEDGTYPVVFSYGLTLDESIAATASGAVTYTVYNGEDVVGTYTTDFDVAKEERTIYVKDLEYSTAYTISIDKVVISYFDAETLESIVAGEFTEPTSSVYFTTNAKPEPVPEFDIDKEFTGLESLKGAVFTIVNKETGKALFGKDAQNLGYDVAEVAFDEANSGFYFKVDTLSQGTEEDAYALRLLTPAGDEYNIWGSPGYLNSQPTTGNCSFILGLNNQNGQDIKDGAVWDIQYVEGKGFTLLNKGTGKYLTSNDAAKSDEPVYWTFCTINGTKIANGIDGAEAAAPAANRKVVENGKVVIYRNGVKTTVSGISIK